MYLIGSIAGIVAGFAVSLFFFALAYFTTISEWSFESRWWQIVIVIIFLIVSIISFLLAQRKARKIIFDITPKKKVNTDLQIPPKIDKRKLFIFLSDFCSKFWSHPYFATTASEESTNYHIIIKDLMLDNTIAIEIKIMKKENMVKISADMFYEIEKLSEVINSFEGRQKSQ